MAIGHFPEGEQVVAVLISARQRGESFETAWSAALFKVRRGRLDTNPRWADTFEGLSFAREAFRRAYLGEPPVRQDVVALALLHVMEQMYDASEDAQARATCTS